MAQFNIQQSVYLFEICHIPDHYAMVTHYSSITMSRYVYAYLLVPIFVIINSIHILTRTAESTTWYQYFSLRYVQWSATQALVKQNNKILLVTHNR